MSVHGDEFITAIEVIMAVLLVTLIMCDTQSNCQEFLMEVIAIFAKASGLLMRYQSKSDENGTISGPYHTISSSK